MINIKSQIALQINQHKALELKLKKVKSALGNSKRDDLEVFKVIVNLMHEYPTKDSVLLLFLEFLQLVNSPQLIEKYSLKDLEVMFEDLCKANPFNYEVHFEYYCFLDNVLNQEKKAKKMMANFHKRMNKKLSILPSIT